MPFCYGNPDINPNNNVVSILSQPAGSRSEWSGPEDTTIMNGLIMQCTVVYKTNAYICLGLISYFTASHQATANNPHRHAQCSPSKTKYNATLFSVHRRDTGSLCSCYTCFWPSLHAHEEAGRCNSPVGEMLSHCLRLPAIWKQTGNMTTDGNSLTHVVRSEIPLNFWPESWASIHLIGMKKRQPANLTWQNSPSCS